MIPYVHENYEQAQGNGPHAANIWQVVQYVVADALDFVGAQISLKSHNALCEAVFFLGSCLHWVDFEKSFVTQDCDLVQVYEQVL